MNFTWRKKNMSSNQDLDSKFTYQKYNNAVTRLNVNIIVTFMMKFKTQFLEAAIQDGRPVQKLAKQKKIAIDSFRVTAVLNWKFTIVISMVAIFKTTKLVTTSNVEI